MTLPRVLSAIASVCVVVGCSHPGKSVSNAPAPATATSEFSTEMQLLLDICLDTFPTFSMEQVVENSRKYTFQIGQNENIVEVEWHENVFCGLKVRNNPVSKEETLRAASYIQSIKGGEIRKYNSPSTGDWYLVKLANTGIAVSASPNSISIAKDDRANR